MEDTKKTRVEWIDTLKFLGILGIYIGHLGPAAGREYIPGIAYTVPLFFFASGFFANKSVAQPFLIFLKKKTLQIMLPYAFFSAIKLLVLILINNWNFSQFLINFTFFVSGIRNSINIGSLWFIPCLYVMFIIHYFIFKLFKNKFIVLAVAFIFFLVAAIFLPKDPSWFWNIDSAIKYYLYFVIGILIYPHLIKPIQSKTAWVFNISILIISTFITAAVFLENTNWPYQKLVTYLPILSKINFAISIIYLFTTLGVIIFFIFIAKLLAPIPLLRGLGRETLILCGTENVLKFSLQYIVMMFGMKLTIGNPYIAVIYGLFCMIISWFTFIRFFNAYFPSLVGKMKITD